MHLAMGPEGFVIPHITKVGEIRDNKIWYSGLDLEKEGICQYSFEVWSQGPSCHNIQDDSKKDLEGKRTKLIVDINRYYGEPLDI